MKKDNKGFSLVELIIVIAIMAVLVGLLAPQYIKYVNNSKVSTDISNGQEVATVFNVGYADDLVSQSTYTGNVGDSLPNSKLSMDAWPDSKVTPGTAAWSVTIGDTGVTEVKLNEKIIWPDPKGDGTESYYYFLHK